MGVLGGAILAGAEVGSTTGRLRVALQKSLFSEPISI